MREWVEEAAALHEQGKTKESLNRLIDGANHFLHGFQDVINGSSKSDLALIVYALELTTQSLRQSLEGEGRGEGAYTLVERLHDMLDRGFMSIDLSELTGGTQVKIRKAIGVLIMCIGACGLFCVDLGRSDATLGQLLTTMLIGVLLMILGAVIGGVLHGEN